MKARINHPATVSPSPHVSAGVACDGWLFISGQGPIDMETRQVVPGTIEEETARTLANIQSILAAGGCSPADVVKASCFLADLADFPGFNAVYQSFFAGPVPPARTTVATQLLGGIRIEIDVIAQQPNDRKNSPVNFEKERTSSGVRVSDTSA